MNDNLINTITFANDMKIAKKRELTASYVSRLDRLKMDYMAAQIRDDSDVMNEIEVEYTATAAEYAAKMEAIDNG